MNNQYKLFHQKNKTLISDLTLGLTNILNTIEADGIIKKNDVDSIVPLIDLYIEAISGLSKEINTLVPKSVQQDNVIFKEGKVISELTESKDIVKAIFGIACKKMIPCTTPISEAYDVLLINRYIEKIYSKKSNQEYYVLSELGIKCLKNKKVITELNKTLKTCILPSNFILGFNNWTDLLGQRMELLCQFFYKNHADTEYIVFTLEDDKDMVFACQLSENVDVNYIFAGIFGDNEKKNIEHIKGMVTSKLVDNIMIVVESLEQQHKLVDKGLDPDKLPQISYFVAI